MPVRTKISTGEDTRRLNIYLDIPTYETLKLAADDDNTSMNEYIRLAVTERRRDQQRFGQDWMLVRSLLERLDPGTITTALSALRGATRR